MSEEIKKFWDNAEILAVKSWYDSVKGFEQIDRENKFPPWTLFKSVNSIQDYKGTRCSIGKWLISELRLLGARCGDRKRTSPNIAQLKAQRKKDSLRRDFIKGLLEEYRKLVKPSQSKKLHTM